MTEQKLKTCPRCLRAGRNATKPINEFGICRERKDGLNLYCRPCIREKMQIHRARLTEMAVVVGSSRLRRRDRGGLASRRIVRAFVRGGRTAEEKVLRAIQAGEVTQKAIHYATVIPKDELADVLARLFLDEQKIRISATSEASRADWNGENWEYGLLSRSGERLS